MINLDIEEKQIRLTAPAKINLALDLTKRRDDGYHEIRTIMVSLDFGDRVLVRFADEYDGIRAGLTAVTLSCPGSDLPTDERNLAVRAAKLMAEKFAIRQPIEIVIEKQIPVAAGLAGGSGDAAAVMTGLNHLCGLCLTDEELCALGVTLGADVPYCIRRGTMLCEGIGEIMTPLPGLSGIGVLLVNPGVPISTKWAYETWDALAAPYHPNIDAMAQLIEAAEITPKFIRQLAERTGNTFESIAIKKFPHITTIEEQLLGLGACAAVMSGSGPTVFGLFDSEETLLQAAAAMNESCGEDMFVQAAHIAN